MTKHKLVLSIFPGIDLLGRAFEEEFGDDICLVRGPDLIFGGDIRGWRVPAGIFWGVIGGDPCQAHSKLNAINRHRGRESHFPDMTPEFLRIINESQPTWFLRENVPQAPDTNPTGYVINHFEFNNRWLGEAQSRRRGFWFGTRDGRSLIPYLDVALFEHPEFEYAITASSGQVAGLKYDRGRSRLKRTQEAIRAASRRPWARLCELQGLPGDFLADAPFTVKGKRCALGNGVPIPTGRAIAKAVKRAMGAQ